MTPRSVNTREKPAKFYCHTIPEVPAIKRQNVVLTYVVLPSQPKIGEAMVSVYRLCSPRDGHAAYYRPLELPWVAQSRSRPARAVCLSTAFWFLTEIASAFVLPTRIASFRALVTAV